MTHIQKIIQFEWSNYGLCLHVVTDFNKMYFLNLEEATPTWKEVKLPPLPEIEI